MTSDYIRQLNVERSELLDRLMACREMLAGASVYVEDFIRKSRAAGVPEDSLAIAADTLKRMRAETNRPLFGEKVDG